jgi:hypothetical protein
MVQNQEPVDVTELLLELFRGLDVAFNRESESSSSPPMERERYAAALAVIGRFLSKTNPVHSDRFFALADALVDLNCGAVSPILKTPKRRSRPNPTMVELAKANVAFALEAFIALGTKPKEAAKQLLDKFPGIKSLAGPKFREPAYSWENTILEWRKTLSAPGRRKNDVAAEFFAVGRDLIESFMKTDRQEDLRERAIGRARYADRIGVFLGYSNPHQ